MKRLIGILMIIVLLGGIAALSIVVLSLGTALVLFGMAALLFLWIIVAAILIENTE